jgi:hypothetical protein
VPIESLTLTAETHTPLRQAITVGLSSNSGELAQSVSQVIQNEVISSNSVDQVIQNEVISSTSVDQVIQNEVISSTSVDQVIQNEVISSTSVQQIIQNEVISASNSTFHGKDPLLPKALALIIMRRHQPLPQPVVQLAAK